ncbi:Phage replication protein CRI [Paraliobacillus sp. PM-2]|uniref:phage/plasmid replication protein, II/X family n=1 Tax=Paraliobacillus sp. PM-2 TaxID=1462524 RepID=UPI00061B9FF2|nr:phage/plasmid replication protein, II/X family [Paraliobacillus sp. PM-2]CQR45878.1 Phage replication protein CRI [Paraliobacillus sp. PM-2]
MAIDTVTLRSPFIDEDMAKRIEEQSIKRQGLDMKSGELLYSLTTARLQGSYDSRISVKIERTQRGFENGMPYEKSCNPYITLECSVHKALVGHNVFGGPEDFISSIKWLIDFTGGLLGVELPYAELWQVRRVDIAEVFEFQDKSEIFNWFSGLQINGLSYKHNVNRFGSHGIQLKKAATRIKFYHKGTEFKKHDMKRLGKFMDRFDLMELEFKADYLLRGEVELKARKLKEDFGQIPKVSEISNEYLERSYDIQVEKFLMESGDNYKIVRNINTVQERLCIVYGARRSIGLFSTWNLLATIGEDFVKKVLQISTFYEHKRLLRRAGCSWHNTNINGESAFPESFTPVRSDKNRLNEKLHSVSNKLKYYRSDSKILNEEESLL